MKKFNLKKCKSSNKGITLIALIITILFRYDEKIKCAIAKVSSNRPIFKI